MGCRARSGDTVGVPNHTVSLDSVSPTPPDCESCYTEGQSTQIVFLAVESADLCSTHCSDTHIATLLKLFPEHLAELPDETFNC